MTEVELEAILEEAMDLIAKEEKAKMEAQKSLLENFRSSQL